MLVADDIEMNRTVIKRFLKNDYNVLEAENGVDALQIIRSQKVDMLLLDIIMPGMDGLEVLENVKKDEKHSNMGILVATSAKEKTERTALSLGADDVVSKPYDPIVIKRRLENIAAVKEIELQKILLEKDAKKELQVENMQQVEADLNAIEDSLHKIAVLAKENADNKALVLEIARISRKRQTC